MSEGVVSRAEQLLLFFTCRPEKTVLKLGVVKQGRNSCREALYVGTFIKTASNELLILSNLCLHRVNRNAMVCACT